MGNCYEEHKDERLEYKKIYDKDHKRQKKEYKKFKAHYRKYANSMSRVFKEHDIKHFKTHVKGWCDMSKRFTAHDQCWEHVEQQCSRCHTGLFKLKYNGKWEEAYQINALHCISCTQVICSICGEHVQDYNYYLHFYITRINSALKEIAKLCRFRTSIHINKEQDK